MTKPADEHDPHAHPQHPHDAPAHQVPAPPKTHEHEHEPEPKHDPKHEPEHKGAKSGTPTRAPRSDVPPAPVAASLLPLSAAIGDPSFALRVIGSGFDANSVINFAGQDEPTSYITPTELTTVVNMAVWLGPDPAIPVLVRNADGQESGTLTFAFTPARGVPVDPAQGSKPIPDVEQI